MVEFKVGEQFPLPKVTWEGAVFSIEPYTMTLTYRFKHPTPEETEEFFPRRSSSKRSKST